MISIPPKGDSEKRVNAYFTPLMVNAHVSPSMAVSIQPGSFWTASGAHIEYGGGCSPDMVSPVSDAKWVAIVISDSGAIEVLDGVSGTNPDLPTIPEHSIPLAGVFIAYTTTQITSDMVFDIRPVWTVRSEYVPDLAGELSSRPTIPQMDAALLSKADMAGTNSPSFVFNQNQVGVTSTDINLIVERGSEPNVSIRWNETATTPTWEFTNDGIVWEPLGVTAGVFAPIVHTHIKSDITDLDEADYATSAQGDLADSALQDITDLVSNVSDTFVASEKVTSIISLSQIEYDGIGTKDVNTLYVIV